MLGSLATHAVLAAVAALAVRALVRPLPPPPPAGVEMEIVAPPPPPPSQPAPPPPPPAALAREITPPPPTVARPNTVQPPRREVRRATAEPSTAAPEPAVGTIEPPTTAAPEQGSAAPSESSERPRLSAAELMSGASVLTSQAAAEGVIALGRPGQRPPGWRDLWGRGNRPTGTPDERARAAAMAPITAALEGSNHMQPAGAVAQDRRVARRVIEELDPVRAVPGLGAAVLRAPTVTIPAQTRTLGAGEAHAASDFDMRHGSSFAGMTMGGQLPAMTYRLVRADLEVDQDRTGAITNVRVTRRSGLPAFDEAAQRAIRLAIPQNRPLERDRGRRSRWSFEVSEQQGPGLTLTGGNQGWTVLPGESNGVQLRMRVRMIGAQAIN